MKKPRLFVLLCALALILGSLSFASADSGPAMSAKGADPGKQLGGDFYILENGKTVSFYVAPVGKSLLYPKKDEPGAAASFYCDILFDCEGPVRARCSANWVHIRNTRNEFIFSLDENPSVKNRTATFTVTGKGYKAKFRLIQFGRSTIKKIVRNKKTVTVKYKIAQKADAAFLWLEETRPDKGNSFWLIRREEIELKPGKTSLKFKVAKGRKYVIELKTRYTRPKPKTVTETWSSWVLFSNTEHVEFQVKDVTGTETIH